MTRCAGADAMCTGPAHTNEQACPRRQRPPATGPLRPKTSGTPGWGARRAGPARARRRARLGRPGSGGPRSCTAGEAVHEHAPDGLQRDAHFLLRAHARRAAHLRPRPASLTGKHVCQQRTCACNTSSLPHYHTRGMRAALGEHATGPAEHAGCRLARGRRRRTSLARRKRKRESSTARPAAAARARCAAHAGSSMPAECCPQPAGRPAQGTKAS